MRLPRDLLTVGQQLALSVRAIAGGVGGHGQAVRDVLRDLGGSVGEWHERQRATWFGLPPLPGAPSPHGVRRSAARSSA
ncbi:hypothetical protein [Nocardia sp. NPDC004604]|uniref:hypothetical protein n=1 Tax=Nocardia sp. NPDC004604 TaxID=3157013 RepID=UPI0033A28CC3